MAFELFLERVDLIDEPLRRVAVVVDVYLDLAEPLAAVPGEHVEDQRIVLFLREEIGVPRRPAEAVRAVGVASLVSLYPIPDPPRLQPGRVAGLLCRLEMVGEGEKNDYRPPHPPGPHFPGDVRGQPYMRVFEQ